MIFLRVINIIMDLQLGAIADDCLDFAKDRWQVVINALKIYHNKRLIQEEEQLQNIGTRIPPEAQRGQMYEMLLRTMNINLNRVRGELDDLDYWQRRIDANDREMLYNDRQWNSLHKVMLKALAEMNV